MMSKTIVVVGASRGIGKAIVDQLAAHSDFTILALSRNVERMKESFGKYSNVTSFGPVLSIHVYPDQEFEEVLKTCDNTSEYALTGSIFAANREDIETAKKALKYSCGNFYIPS